MAQNAALEDNREERAVVFQVKLDALPAASGVNKRHVRRRGGAYGPVLMLSALSACWRGPKGFPVRQ